MSDQPGPGSLRDVIENVMFWALIITMAGMSAIIIMRLLLSGNFLHAI